LCREGLLDTPDRVAKMYDEIFAGYGQCPGQILATGFDEEQHEEMVVVKDIPFYSHCEHHMVPFFGVAHVAYIPQGRVVGISKLARLVECYARRLQIQERMSSNIADDIMSYLDAKGAAVIIEAEHLCMTMRGVRKPGAKTTTSAMRGVFRENNHNARMELLALIK
jgi:GTP cyclohydrolase I